MIPFLFSLHPSLLPVLLLVFFYCSSPIRALIYSSAVVLLCMVPLLFIPSSGLNIFPAAVLDLAGAVFFLVAFFRIRNERFGTWKVRLQEFEAHEASEEKSRKELKEELDKMEKESSGR